LGCEFFPVGVSSRVLREQKERGCPDPPSKARRGGSGVPPLLLKLLREGKKFGSYKTLALSTGPSRCLCFLRWRYLIGIANLNEDTLYTWKAFLELEGNKAENEKGDNSF